MLDGDRTKPHVRRRRWPAVGDSVAAAQAASGLTWSGFYRMNEASGNLVDATGNGNTLTAQNTPTFLATVGDRVGVHYDAATDGHRAAVLSFGSSSFVYLVCFIPPSTTGAYHGIAGSLDTTVTGAYSYMETAGNTVTTVFADGATAPSVTTTADIRTPQVPILLGVQGDRAATTGRVRVSRRGQNLDSGTVSIAGQGTYTGAAQQFRTGAFGVFSLVGGCKVSWIAVATGAQCEGASVLANTFSRIHFE